MILDHERESTITCGDRELTVADFLAECVRSLNAGDHTTVDPALAAARDVLLSSGLPAVRRLSAPSCWVQVGLGINTGHQVAVYSKILDAAHHLLDHIDVQNFFFMHKPPGFRLRFEIAGRDRADVEQELSDLIAGWMAEGMVGTAVWGVYEPEAHLFGGPVSMASVHRLFTGDSLAWLGYHRLAATNDSPGPSWMFSLALLRGLFDGLGIVGWEDRDIWDKVRRQTGRCLTTSHLAVKGFSDVAAGVRRTWHDERTLYAQLSPSAAALAKQHGAAVAAEARRWHSDYFATRWACVGPREAVAYFVVYHWNRGGLANVLQALLTESLVQAVTT